MKVPWINKCSVVFALMAALAGPPLSPQAASGSDNTDGVVSKEASPEEKAHEWTLEEMLMATPMPMTGPEREFLGSHPPLDKVRQWTLASFQQYTKSPLGKNHVAQEFCRWRSTAQMLRKQVVAARQVLGKPQSPQSSSPLPKDLGQARAINFEAITCEQLESMLSTTASCSIFSRMKALRQEIADLAPQIEHFRKEAQARGLSDSFEQALSNTDAP